MAKSHTMTPARRAALRKAQLASARKRKKHALVRNTGRGLVGKKNGSRKFKYRAARVAGGLVAAGALAYGAHKLSQHVNKRAGSKVYTHTRKPSYGKPGIGGMRYSGPTAHKKKKHFTGSVARPGSGPATRHNRIFVTTSRGTTHVRKRGH